MSLWYQHVNVDDNSELILKWVRYYELEYCGEQIVNGAVALRICHKNKVYIVVPDKYVEGLKVLSHNMTANSKANGLHIVKSLGKSGYIYGDNCWVELFKEISAR